MFNQFKTFCSWSQTFTVIRLDVVAYEASLHIIVEFFIFNVKHFAMEVKHSQWFFTPKRGDYSREGYYSMEAITYFKYFSQEVVP